MGGGSWTRSSFNSYSTSKGYTVSASTGAIMDDLSSAQVYKASTISPLLKPYNIIRECRDSAEHPNTVPVILALDVTGSMGHTAVEVAKKLNVIMESIYEKVKDVEFCIMGIGDDVYDEFPVQMSQFESDIRIAQQTDLIYFESGGGGNQVESYSLAWYMGAYHTDCDCWKRGKKGIIITLGDEKPNKYILHRTVTNIIGDSSTNIMGNSSDNSCDSNVIYQDAKEKFDIYHISIPTTTYKYRKDDTDRLWKEILDDQHYMISDIDKLSDVITNIVINSNEETTVSINSSITNEISW